MNVVMPKVGLTMTEGVIVQWHKREGDFVRKGELLFTFETEKSTLDYEAPESGVLTKILVPEGQTVPCLTPVAQIGEPRPTPDSPIPTLHSQLPSGQSGVGSRESASPTDPQRRPASPRARRRARALGVDLAHVAGSGPGGAVRERDVLAFAESRQPKAPRATPVAQRIAAELGVDLAGVTGTGPDGRITREDVERAVRDQGSGGRSRGRGIGASAELAELPITGYQSLSPARRVTAQRMAANAQTAPHVTLFTEADAAHLVVAREQIGAELGEKISYNALLFAICARALREHPHMNASWVDSLPDKPGQPGIVQHASIHIGLAVDTPRGLFVPVLRDVGAKSLAQIHRELNDLVARTQEGQALPDELRGGTFTLTNLGMFEVDGFTPIINLPEAAILGVGRIAKKAVVTDGDAIVARPVMTLSLSFDHRVVDGAPAARFLQRIKQLIERPFALMV
ncbi:MAG: dihydrolipoamide acetyltransferase component of pyruvate dehydrogenase complex [Candidatus Roseilinea sp.]|nr:MAG: dihydrolipoamide acetyltransferase component of pyruvate dehydrogenase complex [Candidatus Roseilinea sp.]